MGGEDDAPAPPAAANARARDQSRWCIDNRLRLPSALPSGPEERNALARPKDTRRSPAPASSASSRNRPSTIWGPAGRRGSSPRRPAAHPSPGDGEAVKVHRAISPAGTLALGGQLLVGAAIVAGRRRVWFRPLRSRFVADDPHRQQLLTPSWSTSNPSREHRRPDSDRTWGTYLNGLAMTWRRVGKTCAGKICLSNRCSLAILATTEIRSSAVAPMPFGQPLGLLVPLLT